MRRALARVDPGGVLAVFRAATGLSQLDLANLLGWSQSTVSMIESGRRQSLYDIRELLRVVDAVEMPREALLPLVLGRPDVTLMREGGAAESERAGAAAVDRRSFNELAAGLASSGLAGVLPAFPAPDRVDMAHVRYLRASLTQFNTHLLNSGGGAVLDVARRLFGRARAMIDDSDYSGPVGQELLVVAAEIFSELTISGFCLSSGLRDALLRSQ